MNKIRLTVGDWSGDGHSQTETIYILCSLDRTELCSAYKKGMEIVGIDVEHICQDYEDNRFDKEEAKELLEKGKASEWMSDTIRDLVNDTIEEAKGEDSLSLYCGEVFSVLWLSTAKIGCPEMTIEFDKNSLNIDIGGYGLFFF